MNRLIIESSTTQASIALFQDAELLGEEIFPGGRGPVSQFFSVLERQVRQVETLHEIVIGVGPGSYSGIRIGVSAAIGLKLSRGVPAWGIVSALGYPGEDYHVVLDARGSWSLTTIADGRLVAAPQLCSREELEGKWSAGSLIYSPEPMPELPARQAFPLASILGRRVLAGEVVPLPLQPLYLKKPHITLPSRPAGPGFPYPPK